jgi:transposase
MEKKLEELEKEELIALVRQLLAENAELKARLNRNSSNSSTPPSANPYVKPKSLREKSEKKPGGQPGHKGHGLSLPHAPDQTITLEAEKCAGCGADLQDIDGQVTDTRYKIDFEVKTVVIAYEQTETECPHCGAKTVADMPDNLTATKQYGEGVEAATVLLNQYGNVSVDKTTKLLTSLLDVPISTGTVVNIVNRCAENSEPTLEYIAESLKKSKILNVDETGVRMEGKNAWLHTASNACFTYNTVSQKRGTEGTDANGVLKDFQGIAVHDSLRQYFGYDNCLHALCGAHLLRELTAIIENDGFEWAVQMKEQLKEMKSTADQYKADEKVELSRYYLKKFAEKYRTILEVGESECPRSEERKQTKARNLLERFILYEPEITRFAADFDVPFDNNQAERDIRNAKVKMKVSGGFRSSKGADSFAKVGSIIGSAVKQGKVLFKTISNLFSTSRSKTTGFQPVSFKRVFVFDMLSAEVTYQWQSTSIMDMRNMILNTTSCG